MRRLEILHAKTYVTRKSQAKANPAVIALGIDPRKEKKETTHETWICLIYDHEQPVKLVDDTLEEMEVLVTRPSKFDVFSNVVHSSSNANLTKNLEDGGNDVVNNQARTQVENTIMT
ncbi:hypothetical protein ACH5RR_015484 [Cinchona calisaya]|uniref:Uncharacterized protein n=1 Tax=Cinchona calisaya TaxID=153742 RepID=A0ABD2ZT88_9GENT